MLLSSGAILLDRFYNCLSSFSYSCDRAWKLFETVHLASNILVGLCVGREEEWSIPQTQQVILWKTGHGGNA
jgi:hypothetical protein